MARWLPSGQPKERGEIVIFIIKPALPLPENELMKRIVFIFAFLICLNSARAQNETTDRLKQKLTYATTDSVKAITLDSLGMYYMFFTSYSDSAAWYTNEFVKYAFTLPNKKWLVLAYARMGFYYINISQYKAALDISLKGLNLSDQLNLPDYLSSLYYNRAWVYSNLGDGNEALRSAFKGISHLKDDKDGFYDQPLHLYGILGSTYLYRGKPDSARYYFNKVDSIAARSRELAGRDIADWYRGMYYLFTGDYPKADSSLAAGIVKCRQNGDFLLSFFLMFYSESKLRQGKIQNAISDARMAYELSVPLKDPAGARNAAELLNRCYEILKNQDSAYHYLKIKDSVEALIARDGNANEIQQIKFDSEIRQKEQESNRIIQDQKSRNRFILYVLLISLLSFVIISWLQWRNTREKKKANALLQTEKDKVETTLTELKATQSHLIQSEKMASLGQLTAGIAHEIQNPLNFVNNFSELNNELITELKNDRSRLRPGEEEEIINNIIANNEKINSHGKRADAIVKNMLQHSRQTTGVRELTDLNSLCDEYLRLSYHGLRAKDKNFNAEFKTEFDPKAGKIDIVPQDIGRVLLNLMGNAFYAVNEKSKTAGIDYKPFVTVTSRLLSPSLIELKVIDNGTGIPQSLLDKIFQPFFTTKSPGEGTGLGLSLAYDIIKAHGGTIRVETKEGQGAEFIIQLPVT
jgi:two-component system, NtrC family, sensor kinase